ncbi:MAG: hypothetical protein ACLR07_04065 [Christensenellales bacterium]
MQALTILKKFFSVDMVIYAAIVIVAATALLRCTLPLSRIAAKLRRAARTIVTESKQNKEKSRGTICTSSAIPFPRHGRIFCRTPKCATRTAKPAT